MLVNLKWLALGFGAGCGGALTLKAVGSEFTLFNITLCAVLGLSLVHSIYSLINGKI